MTWLWILATLAAVLVEAVAFFVGTWIGYSLAMRKVDRETLPTERTLP